MTCHTCHYFGKCGISGNPDTCPYYEEKGGFMPFIKQPDSVCELCGETGELRPYGPNGKNICFDCGMKDEETTKKQFAKILDIMGN